MAALRRGFALLGSTALSHIPSSPRLDLWRLFNLYLENNEALDKAAGELEDARREVGPAEWVIAAGTDANGNTEAAPDSQGHDATNERFSPPPQLPENGQNSAPPLEHDNLLSQDDEVSSPEQFEDPNVSLPSPPTDTKPDPLSRPNMATLETSHSLPIVEYLQALSSDNSTIDTPSLDSASSASDHNPTSPREHMDSLPRKPSVSTSDHNSTSQHEHMKSLPPKSCVNPHMHTQFLTHIDVAEEVGSDRDKRTSGDATLFYTNFKDRR